MGIQRALSVTQESLRKDRKNHKGNDKNLVMITRYNPNNPVIIPQIRETLKILEMDPSLGEIFKNLNFISSQR